MKNHFFLIIILSIIFGLFSGVVGMLISRTYLFENIYNTSFWGDIDFPNENFNRSNLIIKGAQKVVVEQNTKIIETINSSRGNLVKIFHKIQNSKNNTQQFNLDDLKNYYKLNQPLGSGFIITSDGWIITSVFSQDFKKADLVNYVVITNEKKIYNIDKIVYDPTTEYSFIHLVEARDLPIPEFAAIDEIQSGQLALAINSYGHGWLTTIIGMQDISSDCQIKSVDLDNFCLIKSSDSFLDNIIISDNLTANFNGAVIFSISGNVIGFAKNQNKIIPISHIIPAITSLLKNQNIKRVKFGVHYINLFDLAINNQDKQMLIYSGNVIVDIEKNSPAELAGLKKKDIILSIDNTKLGEHNNLTNIIQNYSIGDTIDILYLRQGEEKEIEVKL